MAGQTELDPNDDYDGRDLREVVAELGIPRPVNWPDEDHIRPSFDTRVRRAVAREAITQDTWHRAQTWGVRVLGWDKGRTKDRWLASYAHFSSVREMDYYLDTQAANILAPFLVFRKNTPARKVSNWDKLLDEAQSFGQHHEGIPQAAIDQVLSHQMPSADQVQASPEDSLNFAMITIAHALMASDPERFSKASFSTPVPQKDMWLGFSSEDWERAFLLVTRYRDRRTRSDNPKKYKLAAEGGPKDLMLFVSDDNLELGPIPVTGAAAAEKADVKAVKSKQAADEKDGAAQEKIMSNISKLTDVVEQLEEELEEATTSFKEDELEVKLWRAKENLFLARARLGEDDLADLTRDDRDYLKQHFLEIRGDITTCDVPQLPLAVTSGVSQVHEALNREEMSYNEDVNLDAAEVLEYDGDNETQMAQQEAAKLKEDYVSLNRLMSSGNTFEYVTIKDAAEYLGIKDWSAAPISHTTRSGDCFRKHQVVDIASCVRLLLGDGRFAFLANDCGTGKTVVYGGTIDYYARLKHITAPSEKFRPVLLLTLATVTPITKARLQKFFGSGMAIYSVYGNPSAERDANKRRTILSYDDFLARYKALDPGDIKTAKTVFVTSYSTFVARFGLKVNRSIKSLSESERDSLGLLDDGEAVSQGEFARPGRKLSKAEREACASVNKDKTDGQIVEHTLKDNLHFGLVVCDEAHGLKNCTTQTHQLVSKVRRDGLILSSATPMLNHPQDILGYLRLGFPKLPKLPEIPKNMDLTTLYRDDFAIRADEPLGSFPYKDTKGEFLTSTKSKTALLVDDSVDPTEQVMYSMYYNENLRWWTLTPELFRKAALQHQWSFDACRDIVGTILKQVFLRRNMNTVLELPDGGSETPGDDLPGAKFQTVQLSLRGRGQQVYAHWHRLNQDRLYVPPGPAGESKAQSAQGDPDALTMKINAGVWRKLDILAIDPNNEKPLRMQQEQDRIELERLRAGGRRQSGAAVTRGEVAGKTAALIDPDGDYVDKDDGDGDDSDPDSEEGHDVQVEAKSKVRREAAMGTEEVGRIRVGTKDSGAAWMFRETVSDPRMPLPRDRIAFLKYLVADSPPLAGVLLQTMEWLAEKTGPGGLPNRVLIMVDSPCTQQQLAMLFQLLQVPFESMIAADTTDDRASKVAAFNDPGTEVDVFITSIRLGSVGFDFHECCCKGIVLAWPWSANMLNQTLGRTIRIGQRRFVTWQLWTIVGTIHEKHEAIIWRKFVRQLAAESGIPSPIGGEAGLLAGYELVRAYYNQPVNRYLWEALDAEVGSFAHEGMIKLAGTVSRIARALLANPEGSTVLLGKSQTDIMALIFRVHELPGEEPIELAGLGELANSDGFKTPGDLVPPQAKHNLSKALSKEQKQIDKNKKRAEEAKAREERKARAAEKKAENRRAREEEKQARMSSKSGGSRKRRGAGVATEQTPTKKAKH